MNDRKFVTDPFKGKENLLKAKTGEGSRGGKIIGRTKTGKPIYESSHKTSHKEFTNQDHEDAISHHNEKIKKLSQEFKEELELPVESEFGFRSKDYDKIKKLQMQIDHHKKEIIGHEQYAHTKRSGAKPVQLESGKVGHITPHAGTDREGNISDKFKNEFENFTSEDHREAAKKHLKGADEAKTKREKGVHMDHWASHSQMANLKSESEGLKKIGDSAKKIAMDKVKESSKKQTIKPKDKKEH